jgi:hypothetical protein
MLFKKVRRKGEFMQMTETVKSRFSFSYLRKFNGWMAALHFVQAMIMLVAGLTLDKIANFKLPFTVSFLAYDPVKAALVSETKNIGSLPIGAFVSIFLFISALAHFLITLPKINNFYNSRLSMGINYFRWFEYSISSSVMIVILSMLFGVYDLGSIILIIGCNATMNLLGLMMEIHNQTTKKTNWSAFIIGSFVGIFAWIIVLMYFLGGGNYSQIPWFVYAIVSSYFVLFNLFPVNMVLQYKKTGPWKDYLYGERGYILLSLVAKSLLAWLVFAGTLQPS